MSRFRKMPDNDPNFNYIFYCQGCEFLHGIDSRWQFNGNMELPTISPSYVIDGVRGGQRFNCHSFINDGKIQYLGDTTHKFANKTIDLLPEDEWFTDKEEIE
jgi:hypothetical protein